MKIILERRSQVVGAVLLLFSSLILLYLYPILVSFEVFFSRDNDLSNFFFPLINFIKSQLMLGNGFPLWNTVFFGGTPLALDPQALIYYLPNVLFILFNNRVAFLLTLLAHIVFSIVSTFLLFKALGFSKFTSCFASIVYSFSPRFTSYLMAGHLGLLQSWGYIPLSLYFAVSKKSKANALGLGLSLVVLYYTHIVTFFYVFIFNMTVLAFLYIRSREKIVDYFFLFSVFITLLILIAPHFLLSYEWQKETTRFLLLQKPDLYPTWISQGEFLSSFVNPVLLTSTVKELDSEKFIAIGVGVLMLSFLGLFVVNKTKVILLLLTIALGVGFAMNNVSGFYQLITKIDFAVLSRVTVRVWFLPLLAVIYLAASGLDRLFTTKKILGLFVVVVCVLEYLITSWGYIVAKNDFNSVRIVPDSLYEFLSQDNEAFRVTCIQICLSQNKLALYGLESVEGYGTLQQKNYYNYSWQLFGNYWNYYTLSIPPFEFKEYGGLKPDYTSLGMFNTKYIVSVNRLLSPELTFLNEFNGYKLYLNRQYKQRAYFVDEKNNFTRNAEIILYTPNLVRVTTLNSGKERLVFANVYSNKWRAYENGVNEIKISDSPFIFMSVESRLGVRFVDFVYEPFKRY